MTAREPAGVEGAETARRAGRLLEIVATAGGPVSLERIGEQAGLSRHGLPPAPDPSGRGMAGTSGPGGLPGRQTPHPAGRGHRSTA